MLERGILAYNIACAVGAAAILSSSALAQPRTPLAADPQTVDASVRPGDDFYAYANGVWLKTTPLPTGRANLDTTAMLRDETPPRVQVLIEEAARDALAGRANRVGDFYASWMDVAAIEAKGLKPIADELAVIAAIRDRQALSAHLGRSLRLDDGTNSKTDGLLGVWIHQGFHDGDRYVPHLVQGGLGLSNAGDYLAADKSVVRDRYRAHVATILKLAGLDETAARAERVLALETAIAATHAPAGHNDDVFNTDNTWRRADFAAKAPGMDWAVYLKAAKLDGQDAFVVWQPTAVTGASALAQSQPVEAWRDYLAFHLIKRSLGVLPKAFAEEEAAYLGRPLGDRQQQAIAATTAALGQDIGRLYVARYFPPQSKAAAVAMAENLRAAFRARLAKAVWMSPATRDAAIAKLDALNIGVGYPDRWIDYSGLEVRRDDAYGNLRRAEAFAYDRELAKLSQPVDPGEWSSLLPQRVGAIINFSPNALQFSAAILQPPYFDPQGDAATNYGSAGAGMAHEISHSFDELGNIYDAKGRLGKWWTDEDLARFRAATAPLAAQYAAYCPQPDLCVNPDKVLGEGIGDLAGVLVAYDAYVLSLGGEPDVIKDGLTGDQRFFLSFARRWRRLQTDAALRQQIVVEIHAPGRYRASVVRNNDAWARAYDVKPGDKLYLPPEARPRIW
ncbi:M13 family metallopeptidase [Caulobacter sp. NIBR2454]|uniref:M13 family metallopeptidase n=1 Tax=Caulobacter sp. NIBR2454 TaxID=3015996 RepID=UPI0022B750AF|nr:M13 family metallopeptidase [Caulobacter sp. NIBR2454]